MPPRANRSKLAGRDPEATPSTRVTRASVASSQAPATTPSARVTRSTFASQRVPESTPGFQKPNLPPLEGTPGSRRSYSYGAAAEPLPARPGRGFRRGQALDLGHAVRDALVNQDSDESRDEGPHTSGEESENTDPDEDELAGASETTTKAESTTRAAPRPLAETLLGRRLRAEKDTDDGRSFGLESDCYGDATIASSPGSMAPSAALSWSRPQTRGTMHPPPSRLQNLAEGRPPETQARQGAGSPMRPAGKPQASDKSVAEQQERDGTRGASGTGHGQHDDLCSPMVLGLRGRANPFAQSRLQAAPGDASATGQNQPAPVIAPVQEDRTWRRQASTSSTEEDPRHNLAERARQAAEILFSAPNRLASMEPYYSGPESGSDSGRWLKGANKATAASDVSSHGPGSPSRSPSQGHDGNADGGPQDEPAINWLQLFNPRTYIEATSWALGSALRRSVDFLDSIIVPDVLPAVMAVLRILVLVVGGVFAVILVMTLSSAAFTSVDDPADPLWEPKAGGAVWFSPSGVKRKWGAYLPTLSWSSGNRRDELEALWDDEDWQHPTKEGFMKKIELAIHRLAEASRLHGDSLRRLEYVLPRVVHMEMRDGQPLVAPAFWHALRDLIHEDGAIMTFDESEGSEYNVSSERQWRAIASRLMADPTLKQQIDTSVGQAESRLSGKLTLWETWVRDNDAKVKQAPGPATDGADDSRERRAGAAAEGEGERTGAHGGQGVIVGRAEYLRLVQSEVAAHRSEVQRELELLRPRLEKLARESARLAAAEAAAGTSRAEVATLVKGLARKAVADASLEALAGGRLEAHWQTQLRNQVNYFSVGAGAVVDGGLSSNTFRPFARAGLGLLDADRRGLRAEQPPSSALSRWDDDGDCWCAAHSRDPDMTAHGARLSVQLASRIVPQHLVVEHIRPGATTEPGTAPRDVELWACIDDDGALGRLRARAAARYGADALAPPAGLSARFVKVGHAVFGAPERRRGVLVNDLGGELLELGAETDHVVVRAVSNHGAEGQTCFYRLRLFGHNVDGIVGAVVEDEGGGEGVQG